MFTRFLLFVACASAGVASAPWQPHAAPVAEAVAAVQPPPMQGWQLFGTDESPHTTVETFKKWMEVRARMPQDEAEQKSFCARAQRNSQCVLTGWLNTIQSLRALTRLQQLQRVNQEMNKIAYTEDMVNWGMQDYWETPIEFLKRSGDCEDYSIAKYKSLRLLGFSDEDMRIVVLMDTNLNVLHAVLAVQLDGHHYILDNQVADIAEDRRIRHYQPIYSINEHFWWRHLPNARQQLAAQ